MCDIGQYIVVTTINRPTKQIRRLASLRGWKTICIGDRKTPADWDCAGVEFLSAAAQHDQPYRLARVLPWNHYCRKMLGYLIAIRHGAAVIADSDDDNMPKADWSFPPFEGEFDTTVRDAGFVNSYGFFTEQFIWPRGLPLARLQSGSIPRRAELSLQTSSIGIWQGLADGDPDVDAVYRMTVGRECRFDEEDPVVFAEGTVTPLNSQNTAFRRELFALMYLPTHVTFRYTDILRGFVAQPILWAAGYRVGMTCATVIQDRNPHDLQADFESEVPMYLTGHRVIDICHAAVVSGGSIEENLRRSYEALALAGIAPKEECDTLQAWLADLQDILC